MKNIFKKFLPSGEMKKNNTFEKEVSVSESPAEFETAVSALGFGKLNIFLFLILIPTQWSFTFDSNIMSYITPIAECDLDLSLNNKGTINSMPILGGIVGGAFWGILIDTFGRKKLIVYGFLIQGVCFVITSFSQDYIFLVILKFITGTVTGGLYIAQCTYYAEFHSMEYRSKIQLSMGFLSGAGHVVMPLLAYFFLPLNLTFIFFNGYLKMYSWNIFILVTSILPFLSAMLFTFLPESPKYLMTKGNNEKALAIFQKVYRINTGEPGSNYPIKKLIYEKNEIKCDKAAGKKSVINYVRSGWQQIAPLFRREYFLKLILMTTITLLLIVNTNTLRAWLPQIFQNIHEYEVKHNGTTTQLCTMLEILNTVTNSSNSGAAECSVNTENNFSVYLNSMINAIVCMIAYTMAGMLINMLGRKKLLCLLGVINACTIFTTHLSENRTTILALTSLNLAASVVCFDIMMTMIVIVFPTSLRGTAISFMLTVARSGGIIGNMLFPIFLKIGCAAPFFALGSIATAGTLLCLLLPNTDNASLK